MPGFLLRRRVICFNQRPHVIWCFANGITLTHFFLTRYLVFCKWYNSDTFLSHTFSGVLQMVQLQHISLFANVFKTSTICQNFFTEMSLQMVSAQGIMEDMQMAKAQHWVESHLKPTLR